MEGVNFIINLKLNEESVRYHYGVRKRVQMIAGAEGACKNSQAKGTDSDNTLENNMIVPKK